ncbi:hypothetical protein diail_11071 [Diaporthe ilicicola]|nr:hypothetical protein diail_11071 [Diaporthe ilicicola]
MSNFLAHDKHHNPSTGQIPVPHGPETGDEAYAYPSHSGVTSEEERQIFNYITHPDDSYTPEGVYWADLPLSKRIKFVTSVDNAEAKKELSQIGAMMKKDPLSPLSWYWHNAILPGAGLGLEGYVLFSIGNLSSYFAATDGWKACWGSKTTDGECSVNWIAAVTYLEVVGIMVGQITVGIIGDWVGRRWGLIQDALIMLLGLIMLTASWGTSLEGWVICYAWSLFVYSFGVGGEYPMTATSSMEGAVGAGKVSTREDRLHRGRKVTTAFLMQGWGQLANQALLIILLLIFHHGQGDGPYGASTTQVVFRLSFAIPAVGTLWLAYYRAYKMPQASRQLQIAKKKNKVTGYDVNSLRLTFKYFGGRLLATAGCWFCNDVFFYGNKLFQSQFIEVISDNSKSIMTTWIWNLYNIIVALAGYYLASFLIDNKLYGRKNMQQIGFLVCFLTFVIPAFKLDYYTSPAGIHSFQAMYYLSSFFNQFGPNAVTFLVAAEVFPTPVRASAHGFSACMGKAGALLASVLYNYIDTQMRFYVVPWFGLAGMVMTWLWLPDTTGLDLKEQERRWRYILEGREHEYHGIAVHPNHLSMWERWVGVGKHYNPELDLKQKIEDLRRDWEAQEAEKREKEMKGEQVLADDEFSDEAHAYFQRTSSRDGAAAGGDGNGVFETRERVDEKLRGDSADGSSTPTEKTG